MRVAVVGHVEWIRFARVDHAAGPRRDRRTRPTTGSRRAAAAAVAAIQLALLADEAHLFTALGDDELGRRVARRSSRSAASTSTRPLDPRPQRWAFTHVRRGRRADDHDGRARSCARAGHDDRLPWHELGGDGRGALHRRRRRGAAPRAPRARADRDRARPRHPPPRRRRARRADRQRGGRGRALPRRATSTPSRSSSSRPPARSAAGCSRAAPSPRRRLPGPREDAYGCGDSFMAGLTYALAAGLEQHDAVAFAARCGAARADGTRGRALSRRSGLSLRRAAGRPCATEHRARPPDSVSRPRDDRGDDDDAGARRDRGRRPGDRSGDGSPLCAGRTPGRGAQPEREHDGRSRAGAP